MRSNISCLVGCELQKHEIVVRYCIENERHLFQNYAKMQWTLLSVGGYNKSGVEDEFAFSW